MNIILCVNSRSKLEKENMFVIQITNFLSLFACLIKKGVCCETEGFIGYFKRERFRLKKMSDYNVSTFSNNHATSNWSIDGYNIPRVEKKEVIDRTSSGLPLRLKDSSCLSKSNSKDKVKWSQSQLVELFVLTCGVILLEYVDLSTCEYLLQVYRSMLSQKTLPLIKSNDRRWNMYQAKIAHGFDVFRKQRVKIWRDEKTQYLPKLSYFNILNQFFENKRNKTARSNKFAHQFFFQLLFCSDYSLQMLSEIHTTTCGKVWCFNPHSLTLKNAAANSDHTITQKSAAILVSKILLKPDVTLGAIKRSIAKIPKWSQLHNGTIVDDGRGVRIKLSTECQPLMFYVQDKKKVFYCHGVVREFETLSEVVDTYSHLRGVPDSNNSLFSSSLYEHWNNYLFASTLLGIQQLLIFDCICIGQNLSKCKYFIIVAVTYNDMALVWTEQLSMNAITSHKNNYYL
ncbi:hypothetical protein RFI_02339 [Reticulomyxa filosa]|uniref:Uncharacterized protein n=1 Tax=Reticulomyxa filosa TaxID=46433 RepID=X6P9K2_RETFI|nr:hypothetical protein RFI_02339 [Reticulomyxa filosa]|eukprot:ETO34749.1 hypothetical protein RFI_02339 [Reticulomyxa filosa]